MFDMYTILFFLLYFGILLGAIFISLLHFENQQIEKIKSYKNELRKKFQIEQSHVLEPMTEEFRSAETRTLEDHKKFYETIDQIFEQWATEYLARQYRDAIGKSNIPRKQIKDLTKGILLAALLIIGASWFWYYLAINPFHEIGIIQQGKTTNGFIIETWEEPPERREGKLDWSHGGKYTYTLSDGRKYTGEIKIRSGRLREELRPPLMEPYPVEVEYLPDNPGISKLKGEGSGSVVGWVLRKIVLGPILLIGFLIPGILVLRNTILEYSIVKYFRAQASK